MMKPRHLLTILFILILTSIALSASFLSGSLRLWALIGEAIALILSGLLYRSVVKPVTAAQRGLELLTAQDFNNRLVPVGEPGADKIVSLFNDLITRLKNERLRLREQDTFLRMLIDASPMGIVMLNLEGRVTLVNPAFCKFSGLNPEDISGKDFKSVKNELSDTLLKIDTGKFKTIRFSGAGLFKCYHLSFIQEGFRRHFYLVENLAEEVRKAEKNAYEKVIRMISHEVNNTMGSVQSVLEIVADESEDDMQLYATVNSCRERCDSMCRFIDSFANLARIPEPVKRKADLDEGITTMIPFLQLLATEDISIIFQPVSSDSQKIIDADMSLLQQAIINIVKNAVESIQECPDKTDGFVLISTATNADGVILEIANNGTPISEEVASNLFSTFFSTKQSGRGLGLTLVSEILRKHSCSYSLRTDADGITRFSILFPR